MPSLGLRIYQVDPKPSKKLFCNFTSNFIFSFSAQKLKKMVQQLRATQLVDQMLKYVKDVLQPNMLLAQQLFKDEMQERAESLRALREKLGQEDMSQKDIVK